MEKNYIVLFEDKSIIICNNENAARQHYANVDEIIEADIKVTLEEVREYIYLRDSCPHSVIKKFNIIQEG